MQSYRLSRKKLTKEQKTLICGGRLAYVFLDKRSPAPTRGFSNETIREEENDPV